MTYRSPFRGSYIVSSFPFPGRMDENRGPTYRVAGLRTRRLGQGTALGADTCSLGSAGELGQSRARYGSDSPIRPQSPRKDNPGSRPSPLCTGPEIRSGDPKRNMRQLQPSRVGAAGQLRRRLFLTCPLRPLVAPDSTA
jgi:hypothetical protein